jgi:hypothetical protein
MIEICRTSSVLDILLKANRVPQSSIRHSDNDNTFTWSGPSGVFGCIGQRRVAPASDNDIYTVAARFEANLRRKSWG